MRKVRALRQQAAKLKNIGINSGSDLLVVKTRQLSERADQLEERASPAHEERSAGAIRLTNSGTHAKALVSIDDAAIATPDGRLLFRTGRLWIENGDRVALLGSNGAGKTQLVKRLRAALAVPDANIRGAASLRIGYSDQALSLLDDFPTPWEAGRGLGRAKCSAGWTRFFGSRREHACHALAEHSLCCGHRSHRRARSEPDLFFRRGFGGGYPLRHAHRRGHELSSLADVRSDAGAPCAGGHDYGLPGFCCGSHHGRPERRKIDLREAP